ncbi:PorT family protein [Rhodocytophaga rosea]|uniref:PorT family protein n=1 Tax=Rhodocytophaga rosea TaxID=2704465 RepID=A0A6C0GD61_9BACT|nr:outer membrane beta-barrel protein [Rhodocytophaga rosea]QHT65692.1 PorT family protein [Rhodocytophaga rosea]
MPAFLLSFYLILLFFLAGSQTFAQSDFRTGYIVIPNKDTIQGWVDNRSEMKNARQIFFKRSQNTEPVKYEAVDLLGYGLTGNKMYESKQLKLDSNTTNIAFLEILVKGKISLYHFKENSYYYVEKSGYTLLPLLQTEIKVVHEGRNYFNIRKDYIGTLQMLMADCSALRKEIDQTSITYSSLMSLVYKYNNCGSESNSIQTKRKFLILNVGLISGIQSSSIKFTSQNAEFSYLSNAQFAPDYQPFGGVSVKTTFPWITEKVSMIIEAQYSKNHYYSDSKRTVLSSSYKYIRDELEINLDYIRFPVLIRFTYPKGKFRPFLQAGAIYDIVLNNSSHWISEEESSQTVTTTEGGAVDIHDSQLYGTIGAGVEHRLSKKLSFFIECRGAMGGNLINSGTTSQYRIHTRLLTLQAGISF